jgi:type I restriction enzyme S subunit
MSTNKLSPELRFPEFIDEGEWEEKTIEQVAQVTTGNKDTQNKVDNGLYPFFVRSQTVERINSYSYDGEAILTSGDGVGVGKNFHYIVGKFDFHQRVYCIYNFSKEVCGKFVYMLFSQHFDERVMRMSAKNSVDSVRMAMITEMPISLPSKNEQQKIASCLSSLDEVITAHSQKLEVLKTHKKGLMQNLFPQEGETIPKWRFPEFVKDGEWEDKSIQKLIDENEIISHLDGNHGALYPKAEEFSKEGIPYISANDFISGLIDFSKCKYLPIGRAKKFKKGVAKDGDILFAHNATVGPVAKLNTDFPFVILSTTATYFRCDNKNLINDFFKFALTSPSFIRQYTRVMSQSTRNQVPITAQRKFILQMPKPREQQKIADCLSSLDDLITAQTGKIEQMKLHKKGLMQGLFPSITNRRSAQAN